jgi:hypothetical protein
MVLSGMQFVRSSEPSYHAKSIFYTAGQYKTASTPYKICGILLLTLFWAPITSTRTMMVLSGQARTVRGQGPD